MTSTYGRAKQDIKRARSHVNGMIDRLDWIAEEYKDIPCIAAFFESFKPYVATLDESLITLLHMVVDPAPFNEMLKENDNGNPDNQPVNP